MQHSTQWIVLVFCPASVTSSSAKLAVNEEFFRGRASAEARPAALNSKRALQLPFTRIESEKHTSQNPVARFHFQDNTAMSSPMGSAHGTPNVRLSVLDRRRIIL